MKKELNIPSAKKTITTTMAAAACCMLSTSALAEETQGDDSSYTPAKYQTLRFNEDWSGMPQNYGDWSDRLKKINLNDEGDVWLSMGGQLRARGEAWRAFGFSEANDDEFGLFRMFGWVDLHLSDDFRIFVQGKATHATDRDLPGGKRAGLDVDAGDILDAFAELDLALGEDHNLRLRAGRQELLFGKQRLVSPLDWSNNRRTFDGAAFTLTPAEGSWKLDGFVTRPVTAQKYDFNDWDEDRLFYGLYFNEKVGEDQKFDVDDYFLALETDMVGPDMDRYTIGTRIAANCGNGFSAELEGAYQFGDAGTLDIQAYMLTGEVKYVIGDSDSKPTVMLGVDIASGDDDPTDGDSETFNHLFPLGHAYLGFIDVVGRQNIIDYRVGGSFWAKPKKLLLKADLHFFQRMEAEDALYNAGGGVVRAGAAGTDEEVGAELDLVAKYLLDRHTVIVGGYSHFFAGDFLDDVSPASNEDTDFFWAQWVYTF